MRISSKLGCLMNPVCHDTLWGDNNPRPARKMGKMSAGTPVFYAICMPERLSGGEHLPSAISLGIFMVRLFLFCCLLITSFVRADTIHVRRPTGPGFCHRDGKGLSGLMLEPSMNPWGNEVKLHVVPQTGTGGGVAKAGKAMGPIGERCLGSDSRLSDADALVRDRQPRWRCNC